MTCDEFMSGLARLSMVSPAQFLRVTNGGNLSNGIWWSLAAWEDFCRNPAGWLLTADRRTAEAMFALISAGAIQGSADDDQD